MNRESMARLGLALYLRGLGASVEQAAKIAFSRDPDYLAALSGAAHPAGTEGGNG